MKQVTEEKIINRLKKLSQTDKKIIIGGCLPKANLDRIKREIPFYSAILDTRSINKLPKLIEKVAKGEKPIEFSEEVFSKPSFAKSFGLTGIVQISEGCDLSCTYCSTTISRGDLSCFSIEEIVRGVSTLVKSESKEILLTSQDNGAYKYGKKNLPDLLDAICKIDADFYFRNGMSNPVYLHSFLDRLICSYKNPKIYKFLHIPVQSGSDTVLKEMKRGYKTERFLEIVERFRKEIPELTVFTDIIVGFPTETEDDFKQTLDLLKQTKPDMVNVSKFGKRPGTKAAEMEGVGDKIVKKRSAECSELAAKFSLENNKKWVGWNGMVFVNEVDQNKNLIQISGEDQPFSLEKKRFEIVSPIKETRDISATIMLEMQIPKETIVQITEETVFIGRNFAYKKVLIKSEKNLLGIEVDVQIVDAKQTYLVGEII